MTERFILKSDVDGLDISVVVVSPEKVSTKMALQLAHGMCGCKERFMPFMEYMASKGVLCVANDHRGHGESVRQTDDLGYMYEGGADAMVEDMAQISRWIRSYHAGIPLYLLGHSMGSLAARVYAQRHDELIDGLIVCGSPSWNPLSRAAYAMSVALEAVGAERMRPSLLSNLTSWMYNRRFASEGHNAWTCSDPEVRKSFRDNPRCNYVFTVNGTKNLMSLMMDTYRNGEWAMHNDSMPVLFISGEDDPCMISESRFHEAAKDMYRHGYHNVSSAIYGGMRHEILNEKEKENVWNDILLFMDS